MNIFLKNSLPRRQRGAAAIMFVIMLPVLMGFVTLGVEGGRYLALKGHFRDAAEVASLAVSARGINNPAENKKLAEAVIRSMIPDSDDIEVTVTRTDCSVAGSCGGTDNTGRFYQYQVNIVSTHDSWFPDWTGDGMGFPETTSLSTSAMSRKYSHGTGVDVVFVADFSDSMDEDWEKGNKNTRDDDDKIDLLKKAIMEVATEIEQSSGSEHKNRMALVPFSDFTRERVAGQYCDVTQVEFGNKKPTSALIDQAIGSMFNEKECIWYSHPIDDDDDDDCDDCDCADCGDDDGDGNCDCICGDDCDDDDDDKPFYTLPLMDSARDFNDKLKDMSEDGWTASYEGIIRGAQIAMEGENPNRLIIVLSDGMDAGPNGGDCDCQCDESCEDCDCANGCFLYDCDCDDDCINDCADDCDNKDKNSVRSSVIVGSGSGSRVRDDDCDDDDDGEDNDGNNCKEIWYYNMAHKDLNHEDYCEKIRTKLSGQTTKSGKPVRSRIAVVGIGYDSRKSALSDCAGPGNVFTPKSMQGVKTQLLKLVRQQMHGGEGGGELEDEVGHLYYDSAIQTDDNEPRVN